MSNVVDLQLARLEDNLEFVVDLCRFAENILTEQQVKKKHRFTDEVWSKLGSDDGLVEKIEAEKIRRIRDGSSKREKAQLLVVPAPDVVASIMMDPDANPRHRRQQTDFQITINLGADTALKFDKSIEVNPHEVNPFNDTGPMIAAKKREEDGGEPV